MLPDVAGGAEPGRCMVVEGVWRQGDVVGTRCQCFEVGNAGQGRGGGCAIGFRDLQRGLEGDALRQTRRCVVRAARLEVVEQDAELVDQIEPVMAGQVDLVQRLPGAIDHQGAGRGRGVDGDVRFGLRDVRVGVDAGAGIQAERDLRGRAEGVFVFAKAEKAAAGQAGGDEQEGEVWSEVHCAAIPWVRCAWS
ncbi:hypothetical protein [Pseudomonas sp. WSY_20]|uniref:hypothetical protein n=1 Tax=Pseudomonas sp. WSY_20 TaxID=3367212 RepID=UPI00370CB805